MVGRVIRRNVWTALAPRLRPACSWSMPISSSTGTTSRITSGSDTKRGGEDHAGGGEDHADAVILEGRAQPPVATPASTTASPALGLDPLSGLFLALLALTAVPTLVYARAYLRARRGFAVVGALFARFLLALAGCSRRMTSTVFLGVLGADDAGAGGRDAGRAPRSGGALGPCRPTWRSRISAARASGSRCWRWRRPARWRRRPERRRDRGADRLRHQGGPRPAAHMAARARTPSRPPRSRR